MSGLKLLPWTNFSSFSALISTCITACYILSTMEPHLTQSLLPPNLTSLSLKSRQNLCVACIHLVYLHDGFSAVKSGIVLLKWSMSSFNFEFWRIQSSTLRDTVDKPEKGVPNSQIRNSRHVALLMVSSTYFAQFFCVWNLGTPGKAHFRLRVKCVFFSNWKKAELAFHVIDINLTCVRISLVSNNQVT